MSGPVTWWWIRHAAADLAPGLCSGRHDAPLRRPLDRCRLAELRALLPARAATVATPFQRTSETLAALGYMQPARIEPDLAEQDFGLWEGRSWDELGRSDPGQERFWADPVHGRPPEGESFADLAARSEAAIRRISREIPATDIVAVGHAGPIRAALARALPCSLGDALAFQVGHLALHRIRIAGDGAGWSVLPESGR